MSRPDWGALQQEYIAEYTRSGISPVAWCEAKGRFLNNINAVSKTDFADKRGMRYVRVNAPAGAISGRYYPVVVMRSAGSVRGLPVLILMVMVFVGQEAAVLR